MSEEGRGPEHRPDAPAIESLVKPAAVSGMSPARRRFLTRGLVGGPVVLAALRPVDSLAWTTQVCTYSAYSSALGGTPTTATTVQCITGYNESHYWNNGEVSGTWPNGISTTTEFETLYPESGSTDTLGSIFTAGSNYVELHFTIAYFNAATITQSPYYPYTTSSSAGGIVYLYNQAKANGTLTQVAQFLAAQHE